MNVFFTKMPTLKPFDAGLSHLLTAFKWTYYKANGWLSLFGTTPPEPPSEGILWTVFVFVKSLVSGFFAVLLYSLEGSYNLLGYLIHQITYITLVDPNLTSDEFFMPEETTRMVHVPQPPKSFVWKDFVPLGTLVLGAAILLVLVFWWFMERRMRNNLTKLELEEANDLMADEEKWRKKDLDYGETSDGSEEGKYPGHEHEGIGGRGDEDSEDEGKISASIRFKAKKKVTIDPSAIKKDSSFSRKEEYDGWFSDDLDAYFSSDLDEKGDDLPRGHAIRQKT